MEHIISELTDDLHEKIKVAQRHGYGPMITSLPISEGDSVSIESFRTNQQAYTILKVWSLARYKQYHNLIFSRLFEVENSYIFLTRFLSD